MRVVMITAIGVGGATIVGSLIGFFFHDVSHKVNDMILSFAAGVMLAAAVIGLILPAINMAGEGKIWNPVVGIFVGALFLNAMDRLTPHLHKLSGVDIERHEHNKNLDGALLFMLAVAIGIALQNIPEGIVTVSPLIMAGVKRKRAFLLGAVTGFIEVAGTFIGYYLAGISETVLPFALAFAGGTMLYIISDEMIPETHSHGYERVATYSLLAGFVLMLIMNEVI